MNRKHNVIPYFYTVDRQRKLCGHCHILGFVRNICGIHNERKKGNLLGISAWKSKKYLGETLRASILT